MFLKYVPNAQLLIRLCKRLEINLNEISLADNYAVSSNKQFNKQVEYLCNQHQYSELKNYLESNNSNLKSAEQLQAYYYYLAVACLQTGELKAAEQDLKLSLAESGSIGKKVNNPQPMVLIVTYHQSLANTLPLS